MEGLAKEAGWRGSFPQQNLRKEGAEMETRDRRKLQGGEQALNRNLGASHRSLQGEGQGDRKHSRLTHQSEAMGNPRAGTGLLQ